MNLSEDQVLGLAPDDSSRKAGKDLANLSKWQKRQVNEFALWGECQGSGKDPYYTQVDLSNIAFKCTCPSRKFPCKHGVALLLLYVRNNDSFDKADAPTWVTDWISKRAEKEEVKKEVAAKPVDLEAQAKRKEEREKKVARGIEDLQLWIKDIVRHGLLNLPEKNYSFWENMAKRMVDAQASGLSAMVRALGATSFYEEGWQSRFLDRLLRIYLLSEAYLHIKHLSEAQQAEIRTAIGFNQNLEELKSQKGVRDHWLVLGMESSEENNLITEKTWLLGQTSGHYAMQLQFFVRSQVPENRLISGLVYDAELVFFPGTVTQRAIVKEQFQSVSPKQVKGFEDLLSMNNYEAEISSQYPLIDEHALLVNQVKPVPLGKHWGLQDEKGHIVSLTNSEYKIWKLLALAGAKPIPVFLTGKENQYELRGAWAMNNYFTL